MPRRACAYPCSCAMYPCSPSILSPSPAPTPAVPAPVCVPVYVRVRLLALRPVTNEVYCVCVVYVSRFPSPSPSPPPPLLTGSLFLSLFLHLSPSHSLSSGNAKCKSVISAICERDERCVDAAAAADVDSDANVTRSRWKLLIISQHNCSALEKI